MHGILQGSRHDLLSWLLLETASMPYLTKHLTIQIRKCLVQPSLGECSLESMNLADRWALKTPHCMCTLYKPLSCLLSKGSAAEPSLDAALGLLEA